jgi:CBS-domain-containing membrane protein
MRAIDVMTTQVVTVPPEAEIEQIVRLMLGHHVSALPVVDGDRRILGIGSEGDLLRRIGQGAPGGRLRWRELFASPARRAAAYVKTHGKRAADVMTREVVTVDPLTTLADIADLLETRRIKRVPVVRDGKLAGIVSRADLLQALASGGGAATDVDADRVIRDRLLAELRRQKWAHPSEANIVVSDGIVHLWGPVASEAARAALRVVAENTPGVRGVEDHTAATGHYLI